MFKRVASDVTVKNGSNFFLKPGRAHLFMTPIKHCRTLSTNPSLAILADFIVSIDGIHVLVYGSAS